MDLSRLRANTRFLCEELLARGIEVELLDYASHLLRARYRGHSEWILGMEPSVIPANIANMMHHKRVARIALSNAGICVPEGEAFSIDEQSRALLYAMKLGFPVVMKPCRGASGELVAVEVDDIEQLETRIDAFTLAVGTRLALEPGSRELLIERQVQGTEIRAFVTRDGQYAVAHKESPTVIGDGIATVATLVDRENLRRRGPPATAERLIDLDSDALTYLAKHGHSVDSVPPKGERVVVRRGGNVMRGATCSDITDIVHRSHVELAVKTLSVFAPAGFAGVDIICADPFAACAATVIEINANPSFGVHVNPGRGTRRNVVKPVIDMMFPETAGAPPSGLTPITAVPHSEA